MRSKDLEGLIKEYKNAASDTDVLIKGKLEYIESLCQSCRGDEYIFAKEISAEFCRLIDLLNQQHKKEKQTIVAKYSKGTYCQNTSYKGEGILYHSADDLLDVFYDSFIRKKSAATMKDYVARIKTFSYSKQYLGKMLASGELGVRDIYTDPVLFTYENIELILARFNTKDETGVSIKQKNNIRSALRMLNEFKTIGTGAAPAAEHGAGQRDKYGHVIIPEGTTEIKGLSFNGRDDVYSITIPSTVACIDDFAFVGCSRLLDIAVSDKSKYFSGDDAGCLFNKDKTVLLCVPPCWGETFDVPDTVVCIAPGAFAGGSFLNEITIPDSVTEIGRLAFKDCIRINKIIIPDSVIKIAKDAFKGCAELKIYASEGSYAHFYATENGISFVTV